MSAPRLSLRKEIAKQKAKLLIKKNRRTPKVQLRNFHWVVLVLVGSVNTGSHPFIQSPLLIMEATRQGSKAMKRALLLVDQGRDCLKITESNSKPLPGFLSCTEFGRLVIKCVSFQQVHGGGHDLRSKCGVTAGVSPAWKFIMNREEHRPLALWLFKSIVVFCSLHLLGRLDASMK